MNDHSHCQAGCACGNSTPARPQAFAPHPGANAATPPSWATPPMARPRRRGVLTGLAVLGVAGLVAGAVLVTNAVDDDSATVLPRTGAAVVNRTSNGDGADSQPASSAAGDSDATSGADSATSGDGSGNAGVAIAGSGNDLTKGAVFLQSNDQTANEVVAFSRRADGTLREVGRYQTGGTGTGSFEDSGNAIVLGSAQGEASPIQNIDDTSLLFVANAGSGTITTFQVLPDRLEKVSETPTGGHRPVSLTVNNGLLYVLDSGEVDRRLILGPTTALENCAHDNPPSVTGFRVTPDGTLQPIQGSTRVLSGVQRSGCAQVSFTPDGRHLVATERISGAVSADRGVIDTFAVQYDGTLGDRRILNPSGPGPFGFTFTRSGTLLTSEQNGGFANPGQGKASTYSITTDGGLQPISKSVPNAATDACWITVTKDGRQAFVSSPFGDGRIASYSVSASGALTLRHPAATAADGRTGAKDGLALGATDEALSGDNQFLYQLNSFDGDLYAFRVHANGLLTAVDKHKVFDLEPFGMGGEAAPIGISAH